MRAQASTRSRSTTASALPAASFVRIAHPVDQRTSISGLSQQARSFETNANVLAALGHPIAGGGTTTTLDLAKLGQVYPDRLNTVDMRFTKVLRLGRTRTNVGVDLYNMFNANTGTTFDRNLRDGRLDIPASERDSESTVRALQRDSGLLVDRTPTIHARFIKPGVREPPPSTPS